MTKLIMDIDHRMPVAFCARISEPGSFKDSCTRPSQLDMRFVFHSHNSMVESRTTRKRFHLDESRLQLASQWSSFILLKAKKRSTLPLNMRGECSTTQSSC